MGQTGTFPVCPSSYTIPPNGLVISSPIGRLLAMLDNPHDMTEGKVSVKDSAWPNAQRGNASRNEVPARRLMD